MSVCSFSRTGPARMFTPGPTTTVLPSSIHGLGHSTPTTTWNVYAHVADDSMQDAAGRLDAVVSGL